MARFVMDGGGIEELIKSIGTEADRIRERGPAAVTAGANVARAYMMDAAPVRDEARRSGHQGHLRDHIKVGKPQYSTADGHYCEVYPSGTRDDGQRYAAVGFVLEYGRSDMQPRKWMGPVVTQHGAEINEAMKEALFR